MKVLVTGGAGFIASHVVDLYIEKGYEVVVVDDLSTGRLSNLNSKAKFYQEDIRSPNLEKIIGNEKPDFINHHAAQMDVRRSIREPLFDADVNIRGSINLIESAVKHRVKRIIYISTGGAVYGEPEYVPCDENHPINPICQYGISKHTVEHYLYLYKANYGQNYTVLRYPNVYGPRQDPKGEAGVVAIFTGQMLNQTQIVINGDGEQERDFVSVYDIAKANVQAIEVAHPDGIYNLGAGFGTSINEVFNTLRVLTGYQTTPIHGDPIVGETRQIFLNASKANRDLDWFPRISLVDGLRQTVNYFHSNEMVETL